MKKSVFKEVPDVVHNAVLDALDSLEENKTVSVCERRGGIRHAIFLMPRMAVACLVFFLLTGITGCAVGAVLTYRQRMENMEYSEMEKYCSIRIDDYGRLLTEQERDRYNQLEQEYKEKGRFPASQIRFLEEGEIYDGAGVAIGISTRTMYLPEEILTDEELLELIDYNLKESYSFHHLDEKRNIMEGGWMSRMVLMDDAEVDRIYLIIGSTRSNVGGTYSRMLTADEKSRYKELVRRYEEEGLYTASEPDVIWKPEEYTGEGIAICVADSNYYFPETEMTDEELLQLIDFQHKASYVLDRLRDDIMYGDRDQYPPRAEIE